MKFTKELGQINLLWNNYEVNEGNTLTCINETLFPTIAVSPITTPVAWSNKMPSPIFAAT